MSGKIHDTTWITETFQSVCLRILNNSRSELYISFRYLDLAFSSLQIQITTEFPGIGTDGRFFFVHPKILSDMYEADRRLVNRVYLHTVLHCLLRHLFKKRREDELLWRLSCDIAVESIIDSMDKRPVRTGISRLRKNWYDLLHTKQKVLTAEGIYRLLKDRRLSDYERVLLMEEFCIDDHSLWPVPENPEDPPTPEMEQLKNTWQDISEKTQTEMETFAKDASEGSGDLHRAAQIENREKQDYKEFLRKFAVWREEVKVDPDSFDYVFYTFGLNMYGNMPLIEPMEQREVRRIEEFVIVIDVSMSTDGELVKQFLAQTYTVLTESETYLNKVHIRILQCDEEVRSDIKITSRKELEDCMSDFTLYGGGGTDFRPAFAYTEELIETGQLRDLRGMIYFTDGLGIYPKKKPAWESAFVFMEEDFGQEGKQTSRPPVPPWAIRLTIEKEDMEEERGKLRKDFTFLS